MTIHVILLLFLQASLSNAERSDGMAAVLDFPGTNYGEIPESFDSRTEETENPFPEKCKKLLTIVPRQSNGCGNCWALSGALMVAIRYCAYKGGGFDEMLSARQLTQCRGPDPKTGKDGCFGGTAKNVQDHLDNLGIVTGSATSEEGGGCQPYTYSYCDKKNPEPDCPKKDKDRLPAGDCKKIKCDSGANSTEGEDRTERGGRFGVVELTRKNHIVLAQTEIMKRGPLMAYACGAVMKKYNKKKGAIIRDKVKCKSDHAVVVVGWGVREGVRYWIVVNTWGKMVGDEGIFYVELGQNRIQIEEQMSYALFGNQLPVPARMTQPVMIEEKPFYCFSIQRGWKCPEGTRSDSIGEEMLDFACYPRGSAEARKYRRHSNLMVNPNDEFLGIVRKVIVHRSCVNI